MDDEIKPLLYCRRPCNPKFHCCLWAARLGPVDKNQTLTQGKLDRALCNIEIWGLGVYLVGVCRVWSFCPSTVSWLYISYFKKSFCWSRWCILFQHCKGPWLQRTMTAKRNDWQSAMTAKKNDCKEEWPHTTMTTRKDDCKKTMTARKRWLQRTVQCKEQLWKEVSHKCFVFTTSTCSVWWKSGTRASYSKLQLAVFDGSPCTKASFAQLQLADFEGNSQESFVFTSSTRRFWRTRARKLSFAQLQLAGFEKEVSHAS